MNPEANLSCDPSTTDDQYGSDSLLGRFGNITAAADHVETLSRTYLLSHPGRDNVAPNTALHGILRKFLDGKVKRNAAGLMYIYDRVKFRTDLTLLATQLLEAARVALPEEAACAEFNVEDFEGKCRTDPDHINAKKYHFARGKIFRTVLPDPDMQTQGFRWNKPHRYIAAALASDDAIKNTSDLEEAIHRLEQAYTEVLNGVKKELDQNEEI
ncbi:uncharacterized protein K460DRAFT_358842 [Cucurbitaria berberidis CBS 394.84]|uniref:Uncharacterized protein n=1 Tax=Cucurbitaria berberidis CBS 394.84 TaxID=1168544 RepID=A0A9P4L5P1_9PLEO|nr:uncharacterized protein K460DRAFT_358842 [Cucurbitaria berberidis CBS 394.84]KAF1842198.1 hypothetical protein K460DRAFT_358842 [Cucurbitaria berberidis CBS 394.84]